MDNDSTARLKFDRRLARRQGWVESEEFEQELASLPDAADKIFVPSDEPNEEAGEAVGETAAAASVPPGPGLEDRTPGG